MDDEQIETPLTPQQWTAARMLVATLGAAARGETGEFDFEKIGWELMPVDEMLFALTAEHEISIDDVVYSAKVLIWSLLSAFAEEEGIDMEAAVSHLGMRLALVEPSG